MSTQHIEQSSHTQSAQVFGAAVMWHAQPHPAAPGLWALWNFHGGQPELVDRTLTDLRDVVGIARAWAWPGDQLIIIDDANAPRLVDLAPAVPA